MIGLWLMATAAASDGDLVLAWKKDLATFRVAAPEGEHLAPEAPTWLQAQTSAGLFTIEWADLEVGAALPVGAGGPVEGDVRYSLCTDGGTACRFVEASFTGSVSGRRGEVVLARVEPPPEPEPVELVSHDAEAAFARAAAEARPLLIDFGAAWCPPCQVMAAEVFEDPDNAADLDRFVVLMIDADHPASWVHKDRYGVGSYPTVVAASPTGEELGRHVGYSTEQEFLGWLGGLDSEPLEARLAAVEGLDPSGRGVLALALLDADREEDARAAVDGADGLDAQIARFRLEPTAEAVPALVDAAGSRWNDWIWDAYDLELSEETVAALRRMITVEVVGADTGDAAALAWLGGHYATAADAPGYYALAAHLVSSELDGDPQHDRGYRLDLASLLEKSGQVDEAVEVLRQGQRAFPHEFTWPHNMAGVLHRAGRHAEALPLAEAATALGYGDQTLRGARRLAQVLAALDRTDEALELLARVLAEAERPEEGTDVRTHRYLAALEALQAELSGS